LKAGMAGSSSMRVRAIALIAVLSVSAGAAAPAIADEWWSHRGHGRDRGVDRRRADRPQQLDQHPPADQPYWGTMRPYWGSMRPYWGSNEPPGVIRRGARTRDLK